MVINSKENGRMTISMVRESSHFTMVIVIKVGSSMVKGRVKVSISTTMGIIMRGIGLTIVNMDTALYIYFQEISIQGIG